MSREQFTYSISIQNSTTANTISVGQRVKMLGKDLTHIGVVLVPSYSRLWWELVLKSASSECGKTRIETLRGN